MSKPKYTYADFLWEATRRNENYKSDYYRIRAVAEKRFNDRIRKDIIEFRDKWRIQYVEWHYGNIDEGISEQITKFLNPAFTLDEMRKILSPENIGLVHPYYNSEELWPITDYIYIEDTDVDYDMHCRWEIIPTTRTVEIPFDFARGKVLLALDITAPDKVILNNIKDIKSEVLRRMEQDNRPRCNPLEIDNYIQWFSKYDEIVGKLKEEDIRFEKGAIIPLKFRKSFAPDKLPEGTTFEAQLKSYRDAFKGAVKFIQAVPRIPLAPSWVKRNKKS